MARLDRAALRRKRELMKFGNEKMTKDFGIIPEKTVKLFEELRAKAIQNDQEAILRMVDGDNIAKAEYFFDAKEADIATHPLSKIDIEAFLNLTDVNYYIEKLGARAANVNFLEEDYNTKRGSMEKALMTFANTQGLSDSVLNEYTNAIRNASFEDIRDLFLEDEEEFWSRYKDIKQVSDRGFAEDYFLEIIEKLK